MQIGTVWPCLSICTCLYLQHALYQTCSTVQRVLYFYSVILRHADYALTSSRPTRSPCYRQSINPSSSSSPIHSIVVDGGKYVSHEPEEQSK